MRPTAAHGTTCARCRGGTEHGTEADKCWPSISRQYYLFYCRDRTDTPTSDTHVQSHYTVGIHLCRAGDPRVPCAALEWPWLMIWYGHESETASGALGRRSSGHPVAAWSSLGARRTQQDQIGAESCAARPGPWGHHGPTPGRPTTAQGGRASARRAMRTRRAMLSTKEPVGAGRRSARASARPRRELMPLSVAIGCAGVCQPGLPLGAIRRGSRAAQREDEVLDAAARERVKSLRSRPRGNAHPGPS